MHQAKDERWHGRDMVAAAPKAQTALPAPRHSACIALATLATLALAAVTAGLQGCASGPGSGSPSRGRDGAPSQPQANLDQVPDAEPRVESIRSGGPNKPYNVMGRWYTPIAGDGAFEERGLASWYGTKFHGQSTSSGEPYDMYAMTAAHPTLPIPSYARVRNPANGREIIVRINDRGPFHPGRIVDLSYTGAYKLGLLRGVAPVELQRITFDEIRAGSWRRTPAQEEIRLARSTVNAQQPAAAPTAASVVTPMPMPVPEPTSDAVAMPVVAAADITPVELPVAPPPDAPAEEPREQREANAAPRPATGIDTARGFWVQLGAFRQRPGAEALQRRTAAQADWIGPLLAVFLDQSLFRVQAGPYGTQEEAQRAGRRVGEALGLVPMVVERR